MTPYRVVYELDEDGYWVVDVPELQGAHTQARSIPTARERAIEVIALVADIEPDEVTIGEEEFVLPNGLDELLHQALDARLRVEEAEADHSVKLQRAATALVEVKGVRDAGELLQLSHGRIHQLVAYEGARTRQAYEERARAPSRRPAARRSRARS
jgi:predicted RNase H-like HicB family nuclease